MEKDIDGGERVKMSAKITATASLEQHKGDQKYKCSYLRLDKGLIFSIILFYWIYKKLNG